MSEETTLIKRGILITMDGRRRVIHGGHLLIIGDRIATVSKSEEEARGGMTPDNVIDAKGHLVLPGLINCHLHLPQTLMRGLVDDVDAMTKLKYFTWPIQGHFTREEAEISTLVTLLELIKTGTTTFLSTGLHPRYDIDNMIRWVERSGLRAAISKYVMDMPHYATEKGALHPGMLEDKEESLSEFKRLYNEWHGKGDGRISIWISPRSVGACSPSLLKEVSRLAEERGVGIHMHYAEVENNIEYIRQEYGMGAMEFAEYCGIARPKTVFAHGIYFSDEDIAKLARTGVSVAHCPSCNSKLAMGVARVPDMLNAGVNVCLATDSAMVNNANDMIREMWYALMLHRITRMDPTYPTAETVLEMATVRGAKALGMEDQVGSLEPGKKADIILIDLKKPHLTPMHDPVSTLVFSANGSDVDTVIVNGKILMRERRVLTLEEEQIIERAQEIAPTIRSYAQRKIKEKWPVERAT